MEFLAVPLALLALAFIINGFPNIHIGAKHYHNKDKDQERKIFSLNFENSKNLSYICIIKLKKKVL